MVSFFAIRFSLRLEFVRNRPNRQMRESLLSANFFAQVNHFADEFMPVYR
jgi:hypothetical protein